MASQTAWLAIAALVIMAGCTDAPAKSAATVSTSAPAASLSPETGSIQGLVVDDEAVPLAQASVVLMPERLEAVTDASGAFTYNGVAPGSHTLAASKLGYEAIQLRVDVVVGEIATPKLALTPIVLLDPYTAVLTGALFFNVAFNDIHRLGTLDG